MAVFCPLASHRGASVIAALCVFVLDMTLSSLLFCAATMKPDTIFVVSHCFDPNTGGVETHLTDLTNYLQARHIPAFVLTYQPLVTRARGLSLEHRGSVTIRRLPWIGFGLFNHLEKFPLLQFLYLFPILFTTAFFVTLFNGRNIKAIHCHGMVCAVIGRLLKFFFAKRVVVSVHAVYGWLYNLKGAGLLPRFLKWVLSGCDKILTLADKSREEMISIGIPAQKTATFTYWVDQDVFKPRDRFECRKQLSIAEKLTVLFVGRHIPVKGVLTLLEVATEMPDVQFVFAGDGPLAAAVREMAGRQPSVIAAGRISNDKLPAYYNAADVLCVPSQYEEGFGRIILESLSCGCPVVAARRGGIPEAMDESVGMLIEPDKNGIEQALRQMIADPDRLRNLRTVCRRFAETRYGSRNAELIVEAYEDG